MKVVVSIRACNETTHIVHDKRAIREMGRGKILVPRPRLGSRATGESRHTRRSKTTGYRVKPKQTVRGFYDTSTRSGDVVRFYSDNGGTGKKDWAPLRHCTRLAKGQVECWREREQQMEHRDSLSDLRIVGVHLLPCELGPEKVPLFFQQRERQPNRGKRK